MAAEVRHTEHIPEWKVREVRELVERISSAKVIGVVGMREIPADNLQQMRGSLRGVAEIRMVRNNIAKRAIEESSPEIRPLADYIEDQTALIFSDVNPFKLFRDIQKEKRPMPIKAGAVSPRDIVVQAGETSFSPGPMVGKLQAAGIPAAIKGGKVVINQTLTLVREGEVVTPKVADILKTLEIFPKNVGLDLRAAYEGGLVFKSTDLTLDIEGLITTLASASAKAFSFAVEIGYPTPETIGPMLQKAQTKARGLVSEVGIPVPGMMDIVLSRAAANARALAGVISGEPQVAAAAPAAAEAPAAEKEEETKEEQEDAGVEGLGALFG